MDNYQTQVIRAQIALLWHIRETHINDLTVNQVFWIDNDITYVEVKYLNDSDDSTRADEYRKEKPETIGFLDALELLTVRLHNTMDYLGDIIDPEQEISKPSNITLSYLYRDYSNYKNHNEVVFSDPDNLSLEYIDSALRKKLMDGEWFYASQWGLKDMHFEKFDDQDDHPYHEFGSVELTDASPTHTMTIAQFIKNTPDFRQI